MQIKQFIEWLVECNEIVNAYCKEWFKFKRNSQIKALTHLSICIGLLMHSYVVDVSKVDSILTFLDLDNVLHILFDETNYFCISKKDHSKLKDLLHRVC